MTYSRATELSFKNYIFKFKRVVNCKIIKLSKCNFKYQASSWTAKLLLPSCVVSSMAILNLSVLLHSVTASKL